MVEEEEGKLIAISYQQKKKGLGKVSSRITLFFFDAFG
jgi:hypothetical protein